MERAQTPRVRPNGHTPGVRCLVASKNIKGTRRRGSPLLVVSNKVKQTQRIKSNRRDGEGLPSSSRRIKSNRQGGFPPSSRQIEPIDVTGRVSPLRCVQWTQTDATGRGNPPCLVVWNESMIPSVSR